jgi:hypothetical protein
MARDEPAEAFRELGMSRHSAKALSRLLRGSVTRTLVALLPDIEHSSAPGGLLIAEAGLIQVLPALAANLVPGLDENRANAAALPLIWLHAITFELISRSRANFAVAATAAARRPDPSPLLVSGRRTLSQNAMNDLGPAIGEPVSGIASSIGNMLLRAVSKSVQRDSAKAQEWTGWALLAAMHAMAAHEDELPVPGRTRHDPPAALAGAAFRTGRALTVLIAGDLISKTTPRE